MDEPSGRRRGGYPPVLIPAAAIRKRVRALGKEIGESYAALREENGELVVIGVLKGAFMFLADLVREIDVPMLVDFVGASSYGEARTSSGKVRFEATSWPNMAGRDVLIVEDVLDTGTTLRAVIAAAEARNARSVRTLALLRKPGITMELDFVGFDIDRRFVVGYGLDDGGKWRQLPYVGYVQTDDEETRPGT